MGGHWKEVVCLRFKGERFENSALCLSAFEALSLYQEMTTRTAVALWRAANPERKNLPARFAERTRLYLRRIDPGSAVAPLEIFLPEGEQLDWVEPGSETEQAIAVCHEVFKAAEEDRPLPTGLSKNLLPEYVKWEQTLGEDESIDIEPAGISPAAHVTPQHIGRLKRFIESSHEDSADLVGEVLEADVRKRQFQLWIDEKQKVTVEFSEEQEADVTTALKDHSVVQMHVIGRGRFSPDGRPEKVSEVQELTILRPGEWKFDPSTPPIEDVLEELARQVPDAEWEGLPSDLTDNLDHYLYGTRKR